MAVNISEELSRLYDLNLQVSKQESFYGSMLIVNVVEWKVFIQFPQTSWRDHNLDQ